MVLFLLLLRGRPKMDHLYSALQNSTASIDTWLHQRFAAAAGYLCVCNINKVQSDPLNGSTVLSTKNWTNNQIEPLSDSGLLKEHYKMGPAKSWTINRIEPLSSDPLSELDCIPLRF